MIDISDLKICFLAGTLGQGGAERQLYFILKALKTKGAQIDVISLTKGEAYEEKIKGLGINVHYAGAPVSRIKRLIKIISILKKIKPDILQAQHYYTNIYVAIASRFTGISGIGASRSNISKEIEINGRIFGKLSFSLPKYIIANSKVSIETAIKLGKDAKRLFYLPNGVDTNEFAPAKQIIENQVIELVTLGSLLSLKRQWLFINLIGNIKKKSGIKVRGHILGNGPEYKNLRQLAADKGLHDQDIVFHNDVMNPEIFLQKSDIFVFTSEYEGMPNAVIEAMACGLAVVCTAVGNLTNVISDNNNGLFVSENNIEDDLYAKVLYLINNKTIRVKIGENARKTILKEFSFDNVVETLKNIYTNIQKE